MGLECLLVTSDSALLGEVHASFAAHGTALDLRQDAASAIEFTSRRHLDGLVIDCDDVLGGTKAIPELRATHANKQSVIVAVVNGLTSTEEALDLGADFALCKPIQQTRLRSVLDIA